MGTTRFGCPRGMSSALENGLPWPGWPSRKTSIDISSAPVQLSQRQRESVRWEAHQLGRALRHLDIPVVLLKGRPTSWATCRSAAGACSATSTSGAPRFLGDVEVAMMAGDGPRPKQNAYDQRYYRQWMHELPPMVNVRRGYGPRHPHTCYPLTSRYHPDP